MAANFKINFPLHIRDFG